MKKTGAQYPKMFLLLLTAFLASCVPGKQLIPSEAKSGDVTGTYTLLLYGCHYPEDVKDVAILVAEGSKYPLEIYDIGTSYKVIKGVPADEALREADAFVRCSAHRVTRTELRRIPDDSGGTIGYEIRPIYFPLEFGFSDILLVSYALKDGTVMAYIRLNPTVERELESSGDGNKDSSDK